MPRVISYTPAWLSRPSPGAQLFNTDVPTTKSSRRGGFRVPEVEEYVGPNRTIAQRGSEIFVVAGKNIRWADLPSVKDQWQAVEGTPSKLPRGNALARKEESDETVDLGPQDKSFRILKPCIGEPIRQLIVSPNEKLMAIVTSHTVSIAMLPSSDLLNVEHNSEPIKLRTYTIGPTTHVLSQSSIASVLWHPLGARGNCLITITSDAIVRLWEFDANNRWSADSPAMAIDLTKLAVATAEGDDIEPYRSGHNKVFTSAAAGMDVVSACFGGSGYDDEAPWSSLTLWIAMSGGDVYALCPLLPSRWQSPTCLISNLSSSVIEDGISREKNSESSIESQHYEQRWLWMQELDKQEPVILGADNDNESGPSIYRRPVRPGAVPRLQGPFQIFPDIIDDDIELSDVFVVAAKAASDKDELDSDIDDANSEEPGLSVAIICLMTTDGRVLVALDLEGVQAQWLPKRTTKSEQAATPLEPYLVLLEGLETMRAGESCMSEHPTFSPDVESRYSLFVTNSRGVFFLSFRSWLERLEKELQDCEAANTKFRLDLLQESIETERQRILTFNQQADADDEPSVPACLSMQDSDLGYFLLTASNDQARAAILEVPQLKPIQYESFEEESLDIAAPDLRIAARVAYEPPSSFYQRLTLPTLLTSHVPARHQQLFKQEIRLSTATLDLMTEAHRVLSSETHKLGLAAAELFSRCQTLQEDLRHQIERAGEVADRTDRVFGETSDDWLDGVEGKGSFKGQGLAGRIDRMKERHEDLSARVESMKSNVRKLEHRKLSRREQEWKSEIEELQTAVGIDHDGTNRSQNHTSQMTDDDANESSATDHIDEIQTSTRHIVQNLERYKGVQDLSQDLLSRAKNLSSADSSRPSTSDNAPHDGQQQVPSSVRKQRVESVRRMLDYESYLVEAAQAKLDVLHLSTLS